MKKITILTFCLFFVSIAFGQHKLMKEANHAFKGKDYQRAITLFKEIFPMFPEGSTKREEIFLNLAIAHKEINAYDEAIPYYESLVENNPNIDTDIIFDYGDMLARSGRLKEAINIYQRIVKATPTDSIAQKRIESAEFALKFQNITKDEEIHNEREINSQFSDYGLGWLGDTLIFSSMRKENESDRTDGRTAQGYSDLYMSTWSDQNKQWEKAEKLPKINTRYNDGTFTFQKQTKTAFYMQCEEHNSNCRIKYARYDNGEFSHIRDAEFNSMRYSIGHPSISLNGNTMYFVSDMPGGHGGRDIYKLQRLGDNLWGMPINLGPSVNTAGNEMFPYIQGDTLLFFASDGLPGMGGLDLYCSYIQDNAYSEAVNLGSPFNSPADDFSIIIREDNEGGLFCSDRESGKSDEIYSFKGFPLNAVIDGYVYDEETNQPLETAMVIFNRNEDFADTIYTDTEGKYEYRFFQPFINYVVTATTEGYDIDTAMVALKKFNGLKSLNEHLHQNFTVNPFEQVAISGMVIERETGLAMYGQEVRLMMPDSTFYTTSTDPDGLYTFKYIKPGTQYSVKVSRMGYFSESRNCTVPRYSDIRMFNRASGYNMDFEMTAIVPEKEITLKNIYYDFNKATLTKASIQELEVLASMMNETPNVYIELSSHTDSRGTHEYNDNLSRRRALSVINYLTHKGVERNRLKSKGYGKRRLLIPNATSEQEHKMNRRTTFKVLNSDEAIAFEQEYKTNPAKFNGEVEFKIQIASTRYKVSPSKRFGDLMENIPGTPVLVEQDDSDGSFKYRVGRLYDIDSARELKAKLADLGYADCFIVAFKNGKRITMQEAMLFTQL